MKSLYIYTQLRQVEHRDKPEPTLLQAGILGAGRGKAAAIAARLVPRRCYSWVEEVAAWGRLEKYVILRLSLCPWAQWLGLKEKAGGCRLNFSGIGYWF